MLVSNTHKESKMRRFILTGLVLVSAVTVFEVPSADAQVSSGRNPWCLRDGPGGPGNWDCSYQNIQQCEATASGAGGGCTQNPNYRGGRQSNNPRRDNPDNGTWGWGGSRR
jgi:uncharacterized protein DUF3551